MKNKKGIFNLESNLFADDLKEKLPINLYLIREVNNYKGNKLRKCKSVFYNTDEMHVGYFKKPISNIL